MPLHESSLTGRARCMAEVSKAWSSCSVLQHIRCSDSIKSLNRGNFSKVLILDMKMSMTHTLSWCNFRIGSLLFQSEHYFFHVSEDRDFDFEVTGRDNSVCGL
jgi:hypothetical protein